jgi:hypothetical protein
VDWRRRYALLLAVLGATAVIARDAPPQVKPLGADKGTKLSALAAGAEMLQTQAPPAQFTAYLVGFHPMKEHPGMQMEAHHFCHQVNRDLAQCVLFDGNTPDANLNGIEYIISRKLYDQLPAQERQYWHPHNFEILSGQLVAPGLPEVAEKEFLETKMNSYGKTWHVWNTGHFGLDDADRLPLGEPQLAWSFTRDGQILPGLAELMQKRVDVNIAAKRAARRDLAPLARPRAGD